MTARLLHLLMISERYCGWHEFYCNRCWVQRSWLVLVGTGVVFIVTGILATIVCLALLAWVPR